MEHFPPLARGATGSAVAPPDLLGSPLTGHKAEIQSLVFLPSTAGEPQALISVDAGGNVFRWNMDTESHLARP